MLKKTRRGVRRREGLRKPRRVVTRGKFRTTAPVAVGSALDVDREAFLRKEPGVVVTAPENDVSADRGHDITLPERERTHWLDDGCPGGHHPPVRSCPRCGVVEQTIAGILTNLAPYSGLCIECLQRDVIALAPQIVVEEAPEAPEPFLGGSTRFTKPLD